MDRYNFELALGFIETHLDDAARALETQPPQAAAALMLTIPLAQAQRLITRILPAYAARIAGTLAPEESSGLLAGANAHHVAAILRQLPETSGDSILELLPDRLAVTCRRILRHPEDTVGAWMSTDTLTLPQNINAGDALDRVAACDDLGDGNAIPLIAESRQLLGYIGICELLRARRETQIERLRRDIDPVTLPSKMSLRAAEQHPGWRYLDNLVVSNQRGEVEGLLRYATLRKGLLVTHGQVKTAAAGSILSDLGETYASTLASLFTLASGEYRYPRPKAPARHGAQL